METKKLTVRIPVEHLEFAKKYARDHRITMTELIDRHLRSLQAQMGELHAEVRKVRGLIPRDVDARAEHRDYLEQKHRVE